METKALPKVKEISVPVIEKTALVNTLVGGIMAIFMGLMVFSLKVNWDMNQEMAEVKTSIKYFKKDVNARFEQMEINNKKRFDEIDENNKKRFDEINKKLDQLLKK